MVWIASLSNLLAAEHSILPGVSLDPQRSLDSLPGWEELYRTAGTLPTQSSAWTEAAFGAFGGEPRVLAQGGEELRALAPLVRHGSTLELPGAREVSEPGDLVYSSEQALRELVEEIAALRRPLLLRRVPAGSATVPALREVLGARARIRVEEAEGHPAIGLRDERWQEPGGGLSSSRRSSLRRARRRAEKMGAVEAELLSPAPAEVDGLLDLAFAVEARSWKGKTGTAVALVPAMEAFYRDFCKRVAAEGMLRLDLLRVAGEPVAMQLGMVWHDRHWLFKIGYDEAFAPASPGQILLGESVAAASRAGLESYELLGSRDAWTDVWTKDVNRCLKVLALPLSPHSALALAEIGRRGARRRLTALRREAREKAWEAAISRYVAGAELERALREEERYAQAGYRTTVGFWNTASTPRELVAREALAAAKALGAGSEVSIKLPGMGGDGPALDELLGACREHGLTLHLDALRPDSVDAIHRAALRLAEEHPDAVGCTLASRWSRSAADARALAAKPVRVRLVKGEFEDPGGEVEPRAGYVELARALSGREHLVEVATQDAPLARVALEALLADETPCELQVLHGMHAAKAIAAARELGVPIRIYVPYGTGRLPYTGAQVRRDPALMLRLASDLLPLPPRRPVRVRRRRLRPASP
jgi:CelD/BcsL family acetyltransferase involved in cellulose biosynthesis